MSADSRPPFISPNSYVPLTVVGSAIIITALVMTKLNSIENAIADLQSRSVDRWTATNMESWIDKTGRRNTSLILPSVAEIKSPTPFK